MERFPPEMHEKYLKIILFETERLTDLTQDLLTLNEFDNKNMLLNREKFDIHEVIKNTAASFEGTCTQKKISIELLLATKHLQVYADKRKIHQVLYNLLDNAIKFSDPESTVTIETTERGEKVYISVKDYGIGIPRNALNKIWERFYKTDASRGKDKKGTGLGLSIVKEAIQAHGENINVISTEGVGTEFIFSLPKKRQLALYKWYEKGGPHFLEAGSGVRACMTVSHPSRRNILFGNVALLFLLVHKVPLFSCIG